jgi:hypothetical protein
MVGVGAALSHKGRGHDNSQATHLVVIASGARQSIFPRVG